MTPARTHLIARALAASALGLLGACASAPPTTQVDTQKVAQIERAASRMGTQVIWVRMPTKPIAAATQ